MGATNCPETPRQKMIGMMYLVLTAMLALNVSKDILSSFGVVDDALLTSNSNIESEISSNYSNLEKQKAILGEAKVKEASDKAMQLQKYSEDMVKYVEELKIRLLRYVDETEFAEDGKTIKTVADIENKDNFDKPTTFLNPSGDLQTLSDAQGYTAADLKAKIIEFRKNLIAMVDEKKQKDVAELLVSLDLENQKFYNADKEEETWERHNFDHIVMAGTITILDKIVGEILNAQSSMMKVLITSISADDFKFDTIEGRAIPKSQMVFTGTNYEADIIVAAFDSKQTPQVYYKMGVDTLTEDQIGSATELEGENGVVKLSLSAGGLGEQKYAGLIKIKAPDGTTKYYSFRDKYVVMKPSATVAAEKMNVFYAAIPNPISVSAPVPKVSVSIPGCQLKGTGDGKYDVTVPESMVGKTVKVTVNADMGGKSQALGGSEFRVKRVPDPTSYIGGNIYGGKRSKQELMANPFLSARMSDDFAYDLKWKIVSYRVTFVVRGNEDPPIACSGGAFSEAVKSKINSASANTIVQFTDIRAESIAGKRTLRDLMVRIK
ncbi:MAG: gliding motility protein GldM [Bacteroidales bacterium]|nr:gliding motility protein GldM [Bacteroidales bacterium]